MRTLLIITTFFSSLCFAESFLTILHTNDSHGNYYGNPNKILNRTEYGFVERYKLIQKIRSVSKHTLLLSGGDINTGTPESDQFEAEPDFKAMEIMGYDAMVLGNHEFDNPPAILSKQKSWVNFPFLAANIRPISGQAPFTPYLVKEFEGKRILIVGLLTDEISKTSYKGFPTKNPIYSMENEVQWAEQELPRIIQKEKPDFTILLTHIGFYENGKTVSGELKGDVHLAERLIQRNIDVDLIIGGHSQKVLLKPYWHRNRIPIVQAGEFGKFLGQIEVGIVNNQLKVLNRPEDYKIYSINYKLKEDDLALKTDSRLTNQIIPHTANINQGNKEDLSKLGQLQNLINSFYQKYPGTLSEIVGSVDEFMPGRPSGKGQETSLGRLIAHSFCHYAKADGCWMGNGGIRQDLNQGQVIFREIATILPASFKNTLCTSWMRGDQLRKYLTLIFKGYHRPGKSPLHFYGIKFNQDKGEIKNIFIKKLTPSTQVEPISENPTLYFFQYDKMKRAPEKAERRWIDLDSPRGEAEYFKISSTCRNMKIKEIEKSSSYKILDNEYPDYKALEDFFIRESLKKGVPIKVKDYIYQSVN